MMAPNRLSKAHNSPDAVCLGLITLGTLIIVDKLPETNTGAVPENVREYLSNDGVIAVTRVIGYLYFNKVVFGM